MTPTPDLYSLEASLPLSMEFSDLMLRGIEHLTILCYHISCQNTTPFVQYMLQTTQYDGTVRLRLPVVTCDDAQSLETVVLNKVDQCLRRVHCEPTRPGMFKGVYLFEREWRAFAMVNISPLDLSRIQYSYSLGSTWFALGQEMRDGMVGNNEIELDTGLFNAVSEMVVLNNPATNLPYDLPYPVYTFHETKQRMEFCATFGNARTRAFETTRKQYYFYTVVPSMLKTTPEQPHRFGVKYACCCSGGGSEDTALVLHNEEQTTHLTDDDFPDTDPCFLLNAGRNPDLRLRNNETVPLGYFILLDS